MSQTSPKDEYFLDNFGRVRPTDQIGRARHQSYDVSSFNAAMDAAVAVAMKDVFPDPGSGLGSEELGDLRAKRYLDIVDGFFLVTAVDPRLAVWKFQVEDEVFYTMRPDFAFKSLVTDLNEEPINVLESAIRKRLTDYYRELEALKYALAACELNSNGFYPVEFWTEFWKVRGVEVPEGFDAACDGPTSQSSSITTRERNTLLTIIAALCDYSAIDLKARGVVPQIARLTEELGAPVSDDSVRRALAKIDEAVESRKK